MTEYMVRGAGVRHTRSLFCFSSAPDERTGKGALEMAGCVDQGVADGHGNPFSARALVVKSAA